MTYRGLNIIFYQNNSVNSNKLMNSVKQKFQLLGSYIKFMLNYLPITK